MRANGHSDLETGPCGFIIHPSMGWLGAVDTDPSVDLALQSSSVPIPSEIYLQMMHVKMLTFVVCSSMMNYI